MATHADVISGRRIEIRGTVQGVGFRPWVYRVAVAAGIGGRIRNDTLGVTIEAFGHEPALERFISTLRDEAPLPTEVRTLRASIIPGEPVEEFSIVASVATGAPVLSIPPDLATCPECVAEIRAPADRRYRYPFTNCTNCGPRFTIATGVPYDRAATSMSHFAMCPRCRGEYQSIADRRFHAQPNACPDCGPRLELLGPSGEPLAVADPLIDAARRLMAGDIVAVKGLGGFHLACDATHGDIVGELRARKHRDEKPFAVMVRDVATARALALLDPVEESLLTSVERPIVLLSRRPGGPVATEVAPDSDRLGVMLPYTPLHHLLLDAVGRPLVMTSGNLSDEPICHRTRDAVTRLRGIADAFLIHDRPIAVRCDDSVACVIAGAPMIMRRARGYVPRPIVLHTPVSAPILAFGGHLKNTFCLARGELAYLGPHVGDLGSIEASDFLAEQIERMCHLLDFVPEVVAHDLHPDYESTRMALARPELRVAVQHHHAHVAAAIAEHGLSGPVIGVAYDGTGYGTDGTAWGGEVMIADLAGYRRIATLRPVRLPGGDAAIRQVWRIALALVTDAFDEPPIESLPLFAAVSPLALDSVGRMIASGVSCPLARGVGRYFDGFGALGLERPRAGYEGQVAVAWDRIAGDASPAPYPFVIDRACEPAEIDLRPTVRAAVADVIDQVSPAEISARFRATLVCATADAVAGTGYLPVVLTGGVFQNQRLAERVVRALPEHQVHLHGAVPPNDGGIALGQALVADAVVRKGASDVPRGSR
jgi:hydrogenase maturation protein HypF